MDTFMYMFFRTDTGYHVEISTRPGKREDLGLFSHNSIYRCVKPGDELQFYHGAIYHAAICLSTDPHLIVHNPGPQHPDEDIGIEIKPLYEQLKGEFLIRVVKSYDAEICRWARPVYVSHALSCVGMKGYNLFLNSCQTFAKGSMVGFRSQVSIQAVLYLESIVGYALSSLTFMLVFILTVQYATPIISLTLAAGSVIITSGKGDYVVARVYGYYERVTLEGEVDAGLENVMRVLNEGKEPTIDYSKDILGRLEAAKLFVMNIIMKVLVMWRPEDDGSDLHAYEAMLVSMQCHIFKAIFHLYSMSTILETEWDGHVDKKAIVGLRIISNYIKQPYFQCMDCTRIRDYMIGYLMDIANCIIAMKSRSIFPYMTNMIDCSPDAPDCQINMPNRLCESYNDNSDRMHHVVLLIKKIGNQLCSFNYETDFQ